MSYVLVTIAALAVSGLTLYSGFGLGTLLMPVYVLFFPVEMAVAATAVVHVANNIFKIGMVGRQADRSVVLRFGVPAILAAFVGAAVLSYQSGLGQLTSYSIGGRMAVITPIKLAMASLIFAFALLELLPSLRGLKFDRKHLLIGGILSGFFGGLSGHQGALRSAFLAKVGISAEAFVGTNAVIGLLVDLARLSTYVVVFFVARTASPLGPGEWPLVLTGIAAAFIGVLIGKRFLHRITLKTVQALIGVLLLGIALALGAGII